MAKITNFKITASDGVQLAAALYAPDVVQADCSLKVLLNAATGAPRSYYEPFANFLTDHGIHVLLYDYRGLFSSASGSARDDLSVMRDWGELDTEAALQWLLYNLPGDRIGFIGHSIGGALLGLAKSNVRVSSAVSVASPSGYWGHWPLPLKVWAFIAYTLLVPVVVTVVGYLPARFSGAALPKGVALEWARWCGHPDFVVDEHGRPLHDCFAGYCGPYLFLSTVDDHFAPPESVQALSRLFRNAQVTHKVIHPSDLGVRSIGHFGLFRKSMAAEIWSEIACWLKSERR